MTIYLSKPALVSAMGSGLEQHLHTLLNLPATSPLSWSSDWVQNRRLAFGAVQRELRPFPSHIAPEHVSRNNRLLWDALAQIEPQIQLIQQRFGNERISVVMGTSVSGADENLPLFEQMAQRQPATYSFKQQTQLHCDPADFVQQIYGLQGMSYGVSTACTSGARALMSAARLLQSGVCDAVICGGVDTLSPLTINGFASLEVLSDSLANPFSAHRNGINIGEAVAVFIATREPLDDAESIALLGYGASSDAYHISSPRPDGSGAAAAFSAALQHAQVSASDIGWINLHGTGTHHNDSMESLAVASVFGCATPATSTKPLTGHTLGAAGALEAAFLWGVISRQHNPQGKLPAQQWDGIRDTALPPILLTDANSAWQNANAQRIGASSSFAFGGNNAVLIMGECHA
ncbi:beta-ketoacyl-ACP synthase [Kingella kingae]|uniref:beta-ketoacyl-ACP synthase n=2 Tax=Kingella kingae TaxID=504 RepID=UPI00254FEB70|nr:beta-ketoacyl-ACP synthase [Kingella kingae]MDK4528993.1 beta-ketoacyl-ACP synthase [Kingella kingae]MDK4543553.1 beta-ketoacyl-ACP synthase [Kingella kingae]MDK4632119.1 beta-ketoacyl-ACP synthase [Kingella kingae]MDK4634009.1 beta-ketoacyl-ACP synthase [Kingella kingae]MDK4677721.1 beta-ketoacyl-ACP synthase [Kingella kingae]